jgi:tRNA (guanine37-N1)-methyltransferase
MKFVVLTIFPEMFDPFWDHGIIRRAIDHHKIFASTLNIRDFAEDKHQVTDDRPYGGGSGMVMKPEPLAGAIRAANRKYPSAKTILLSPQGRVFDQAVANELAGFEGLVLVCGRYEGVDERISHDLIDDEISIGDYVLTGGELAAMVVIDAVTRQIPGPLKKIHFQTVCWNTRTTPDRKFLKTKRYRRSCCQGITKQFKIGAWNLRYCAPY